MILQQPFRPAGPAIKRHTQRDGPGAIVRGGRLIVSPEVNIRFVTPEFGGRVGEAIAEIQAMIQHDQVRAVFPTFLEHVDKRRLLLGAQLAADRIHLEQVKIVIPAQLDQHVRARTLLLRRIAETIRPQPDAEATPERLGFLGNRAKSVWEILLEPVRVDAAVAARSINGPGVERVDVQVHAVFVMKPLEEIQIGQSLPLG